MALSDREQEIRQKTQKIRKELPDLAREISERYGDESGGPPVVVVVAGSDKYKVGGTVTGYANIVGCTLGRMRDRLGILEAAKQIEAFNHLSMSRMRGHLRTHHEGADDD